MPGTNLIYTLPESEAYMSSSTKFIHLMVEDIAYLSINLMELLSILIVVVTTFIAFYKLVKKKPYARVYLLHGQSIALSFKLGAEILRTVPARTMDEIWQIFWLIVIKIMMGLLIDWELKGVEGPEDAVSYAQTGNKLSTGLHILKEVAKARNEGKPKEESGKTANPETVQKEKNDSDEPLW